MQTSSVLVSVIKVTVCDTCMKYVSAFRREMLAKPQGKECVQFH